MCAWSRRTMIISEIHSQGVPFAGCDFHVSALLLRPLAFDRVGSAWLIRKFIDPKARFIFNTDPAKHRDAIPYDMFEVEFSHRGDDCTFETLAKRFGIADKAVLKIAEMVHDADLEDGKFQTTVCVGIDQVLKGWAKGGLSDEELLKRGGECFDAIYQQLRNPHPAGEGLRWVAFGFQALRLSDHEILEREFIVYDALYTECQRRVQTE